jgi:hypothetical protein
VDSLKIYNKRSKGNLNFLIYVASYGLLWPRLWFWTVFEKKRWFWFPDQTMLEAYLSVATCYGEPLLVATTVSGQWQCPAIDAGPARPSYWYG